MSGRQDPAAADTDGERSTLISLDEQHRAVRILNQAFEAGELGQDELRRRLGRVQRAVTPRDLWKASGHRAGSRRRSDWKELRRALWLQVAIVSFAVVAMLLVLYGTLLYYHGDSNVHIWPWEWGQS
jgi:anti-sigma-K factor RskA